MKRSVFDNVVDIPYFIDEKSIYENIGVDNERIINGVHNSISKDRKRKAVLFRRSFIAAAAAVMMILIFSIPVSAENIYGLYCRVFGGDGYTLELPSVSDMKVSLGDPLLMINSLNVGSDESGTTIIDIRISKKNGADFRNGSFSRLTDQSVSAYSASTGDPNTEKSSNIEAVITDDDDTITSIGAKAKYELSEDGKTLGIVLFINAEGNDGKLLNDKKIRIISHSYLAMSIDKVIATYDDLSDKNFKDMMKLKSENEKYNYDIFTNSYSCTDIIYNGKAFDLAQCRIKSIALPFELSFIAKENVKVCDKLISDDKLYDIFGNKQTNGRLRITPFSVSLTAENDGTHNGEKLLYDSDNSYIITDDGKRYYLAANGCYYDDKNTVVRCIYGLYPNNSNENYYIDNILISDISAVKEIVFNGERIYSKLNP